MVLLEVKDLVMQYDGRRVLKGVDLSLEEGQVKAIMGPSGCGKSTLLRCLNRLVEPTAGQVFFRGEEVTGPGVDLRRLRQQIGFVFQNFALYRHLTVQGNATLGLRKLRGMTARQADEKALYELERVGLLEHRGKYPAQLSGGQKQRAAIVRALAMDPLVLFLDEPTSALDPEMTREVTTVLNRLYLDNVTMLLVTHEPLLAQFASDSVLFMDEGKILAEEIAERLFHNHSDPRIRQFYMSAVDVK